MTENLNLTYKLPPQIKGTWLQLLRHGELPQGKGGLLVKVSAATGEVPSDEWIDTFCCLGVCHAAIFPNEPVPHDGRLTNALINRLGPRRDYRSVDINAVIDCMEQAFQPTTMLSLEVTVQGFLINMNDARGMTFKEIAAWIEEHL